MESYTAQASSRSTSAGSASELYGTCEQFLIIIKTCWRLKFYSNLSHRTFGDIEGSHRSLMNK